MINRHENIREIQQNIIQTGTKFLTIHTEF